MGHTSGHRVYRNESTTTFPRIDASVTVCPVSPSASVKSGASFAGSSVPESRGAGAQDTSPAITTTVTNITMNGRVMFRAYAPSSMTHATASRRRRLFVARAALGLDLGRDQGRRHIGPAVRLRVRARGRRVTRAHGAVARARAALSARPPDARGSR